jgi:hypothetical protein
MKDRGAPPPGELEELLAVMAEIEDTLKVLQENIAPLIDSLGMNLQAWAISLGDGYRAEADALYRRIGEAAAPGSAYTYEQLADRDAAGRLARKGQRADRIGRALGKGATVARVALQIFASHQKNKRIETLINQEKQRLPQIRDLLAAGDEQVQNCLALEQRIFGEYARRRPAGRSEHREVDRRLEETVKSMRQLTGLQARLEYCRQVYQAIEEFQSGTPWQVEESKQRLDEVAAQSLAESQVRSTAYFLDTLDKQIQVLEWQPPYYQNGLPKGVGFFFRRGVRLLPPEARLRASDRHLERLRAENPAPAQPLKFLRAVYYAQRELGSAPLIFGWRMGRVYAGLLILFLAAAAVLLAVSGLGESIFAVLRQLSAGSAGQLPSLSPGQTAALFFFLFLFASAGGLAWLILGRR